MDQLAQRAFVSAKTIGRIEATGAGSAQPALAPLVEREPVLERRPAAHAEIFGHHRRGRRQTSRAHANASDFRQRRFADGAIVGENERKKTARNLAENGGESGGKT